MESIVEQKANNFHEVWAAWRIIECRNSTRIVDQNNQLNNQYLQEKIIENMSDQKHYYAFISHSTTDEKIALWLRKELEGYHIPSAVQRDYHAPKRLRPIFLYQTDLAGTQLEDALGQSLADSQYLIVVCSPSAAQSGYVNNEVQHFINTGRADKIIPFIVSGTPYASPKGNPSDECFPPALISLKEKGQESRGINLSEMTEKNGSKMSAVVNVIASMLGVRYDVLWDRYQHRRRKIQIAVAIGIFLLCLVGLVIWDYTRPTYRYFADYVDKWGVPEGVIELTKEQQRHRHRMYQFEYQRTPFGEPNAFSWRVTKVSYVNSAHIPQVITNTEYMSRYPIHKIQYNSQTGKVIRYVFCDTKGKVLLHHVLSEFDHQPATIVDFVNSEEQNGQGFVGGNLSSISIGEMDGNSRSSISRYVYERDSNGYIVKQTYHANNDYNLYRSAIPDANGIYGRKYLLDSLGRIVQMKYIGKHGDAKGTQVGVAAKLYTYDKYGNICRCEYLDVTGLPVINELLWSIGVAISDEWGNIIEERSLAPNNKLSTTIYGYSICRAKYNTRGNEIECDFLDTLGRSCIIPIMGCSKWKAKYGKRGEELERSFWNSDTSLCCSTLGASIVKSKYDKKNNHIECAFFNVDEKPCLGVWGFHKWRAEYDSRGNESKRSFYDTIGNPCTITDGYFRRESKFDTESHKIEERYYDINNSLCFHVNCYAMVKIKYDMRGNCIEECYYNPDGKLCNSSDGFAIWKASYDEQGHRIQEAFYDTLSQPCLCNNQYARVTSVYNEHGYCVELSYYDTQGEMTNNDKGYARKKIDYDEYGNIIKEVYYTNDNSQSLTKANLKKWKPNFNRNYEIISIQYEDTINDK